MLPVQHSLAPFCMTGRRAAALERRWLGVAFLAALLAGTHQFTDVAKDASGNTISGKSFTWQSSAPAIVSVDAATGVATALDWSRVVSRSRR